MKTVIDAVNEFKGEYPYAEPSIVEQISTGNLDSWREKCDRELNKDNFRIVCLKEEFNQCVADCSNWFGNCSEVKPVTLSPIYTQEMADNGELPSVGMDCKFMHGGDMQIGTVTAKTKRFIIFTEEGGMERVRKIEGCAIEAITPPIELIDGERYQFQHKTTRGLGFYNERLDEFSSLNHKIHIHACTNIQLLTVEVNNHD